MLACKSAGMASVGVWGSLGLLDLKQGTVAFQGVRLAADNLADIAITDGESVSQAESLRVLRPGGVLLDGRSMSTKPVPKGSGEWAHPYHGAFTTASSDCGLLSAP